MKSLPVFLALITCSCTQTARITLRNESAGNLVYANSATTEVRNNGLGGKNLASRQAAQVPLATVVTRGLDLPFVMLGTTSATSHPLTVRQDTEKKSKQYDFPFPQQTLTDRWLQQDYLGRYLTRDLGSMVIVDPAADSYWKPLGREPVKLKVTER